MGKGMGMGRGMMGLGLRMRLRLQLRLHLLLELEQRRRRWRRRVVHFGRAFNIEGHVQSKFLWSHELDGMGWDWTVPDEGQTWCGDGDGGWAMMKPKGEKGREKITLD